jgi:hypothetical protein
MFGRHSFAATAAIVFAGAAAIASGAGSPRPGELAPIHGHYAPRIDPANFASRVNNPYLPWTPGTRMRLEGSREGTPQVDEVVVLRRGRRVLGVRCTIVRDTVFEKGVMIERTFDWYAQDRQGNVWYMGEASYERSHGRLRRAGDSWEGGVDGARPGIIMPAHPRHGDAYRQEFYPPGEALDQARVLRSDAHWSVPYGSFDHVLVTSERSPLEPQIEHKYYARGIGEIGERVVRGHAEAFSLVSVARRPRGGGRRLRGAAIATKV